MGNRIADLGFWGLVIYIGDCVWNDISMQIEIIFELKGYLIVCEDAGLVRKCGQHNLTLFLNLKQNI